MPPRAVLIRRAVGFISASSARADQVAVGVDQRDVNGDEVGALQQVVERDELDVEELGALDRDDRVVGDDLHLQPVRALGHLGADVAEPDHAQRLAADLGADELRRASTRPRLTDASACGTQRASAKSSAIVCSAAATMLPRGALTTRMPLRVAAGTSMLSTPTPARPDHAQPPARLRGSAR